MKNSAAGAPPPSPPKPRPQERKASPPFSDAASLLPRLFHLKGLESIDTGDLILLALLFLLWQEKADEELIIALALLLIL